MQPSGRQSINPIIVKLPAATPSSVVSAEKKADRSSKPAAPAIQPDVDSQEQAADNENLDETDEAKEDEEFTAKARSDVHNPSSAHVFDVDALPMYVSVLHALFVLSCPFCRSSHSGGGSIPPEAEGLFPALRFAFALSWVFLFSEDDGAGLVPCPSCGRQFSSRGIHLAFDHFHSLPLDMFLLVSVVQL